MDIASALQSSGIARIDAETMLAFLLGSDRSYLHAHPREALTQQREEQWTSFVARRKTGEPVAYIVGQREFYGRTFFVDRRVHIPRPSTENLVAMALDALKEPKDAVRDLEPGIIGVVKILHDCSGVQSIVDVGTGSGCIAITLALERPDLHVIATDVSPDALEVAMKNAKRLHADVTFLEGDLLDPVKRCRNDFIVISNPPYIPQGRPLALAVQEFEPSIALRSGRDGTDAIVRLTKACKQHRACKGWVIECLTQQQDQAL